MSAISSPALVLALDSTINQKVWDFLLDGGAFMFFIVACSLVSAAIVIHRWLSLRRELVLPAALVSQLENAQPGEVDVAALRAAATASDTALGDTVEATLAESCDDANEAARSAEAVAREEVLRLQTGLTVLEDVITIAPLLGLLGTVSGLVSVFAVFGTTDGGQSADPAVLASGIARALNTTIAGLAVAVPTVVARSYFTKRIETMAARMEVLIGRLIQAVYHDKPTSEPAAPNSMQAPLPTTVAGQSNPAPAIEPEHQVIVPTEAPVPSPTPFPQNPQPAVAPSPVEAPPSVPSAAPPSAAPPQAAPAPTPTRSPQPIPFEPRPSTETDNPTSSSSATPPEP